MVVAPMTGHTNELNKKKKYRRNEVYKSPTPAVFCYETTIL